MAKKSRKHWHRRDQLKRTWRRINRDKPGRSYGRHGLYIPKEDFERDENE